MSIVDPREAVGNRATLLLHRPGGDVRLPMLVQSVDVQHQPREMHSWSSLLPTRLAYMGPPHVTVRGIQCDPEPVRPRRRRVVARAMPAAMAMD